MTTSMTRPADQQVSAPPQPAATQPQTQATETPPAARPPAHVPRAHAGTAQLALRGQLSTSDRSWLQPRLEELVASGARTLEIDLSAVTRLDAAIARLLLGTDFRLGDVERRLLLIRPQPPVRRLLQWVGGRHLIVR